MANCDGFFENNDILYEPEYQDLAVSTVKHADFYDPTYKKWLILCWFDTTYGAWDGPYFNKQDSRDKMSEFLKKTPYRTFEKLLADKEN